MRTLDSRERILFEQYFSYRNMTQEEGDMYLNILLNSTIFNAYHSTFEKPIETELVILGLKKESDTVITFDGAFAVKESKSNKSENRTISGKMNLSETVAIIDARVERLGVYTPDGELFEYSILDVMKFNPDGTLELNSKIGYDLKIDSEKEIKQSLDSSPFDNLVLKKTK